MEKFAYLLGELTTVAPMGRSTAYKEIEAGRLKARKLRSTTVVLREDLLEYLAALPEYPPSEKGGYRPRGSRASDPYEAAAGIA